MKTTLFFLLGLSLFIISGCGAAFFYPGTTEDVYEPYESVISISHTEGFRIFTQDARTLERFEPKSGVYLGAYILSDRTVAGCMETFERLTNMEHSFYTYFLRMGQPFPADWVLSCIANMAMPNIVLVPQSMADPFNERLLQDTARKFGEINVQMFVHFFPISNDVRYDADGYISFFRMAREYFNQYAPNAALVWVIDMDSLHLIERLYPGDEYVDWVGINVLAPRHMGINDIRLKLDLFYFHFHERKPIFISQLGISHFSLHDHAYYVAEAAGIMAELFSAFLNDYPRIKAVNYMSFNGIDPVNMRRSLYNFSVTDNDHMTRAYTAAISDARFLSSVDFGAGGEQVVQRVRQVGNAFYHDGDFFIRAATYVLIGNGRQGCGNEVVSTGMNEYHPLKSILGDEEIIRADFNLRTVDIVR